MPARRRPKSTKVEPAGPIEQFATMLRESEARERSERERRQLEREQQEEAARRAAAHAAELAAARRELDRAIAAARTARRTGVGVADADRAWRQAKARLIELETGAAPDWARSDDS